MTDSCTCTGVRKQLIQLWASHANVVFVRACIHVSMYVCMHMTDSCASIRVRKQLIQLWAQHANVGFLRACIHVCIYVKFMCVYAHVLVSACEKSIQTQIYSYAHAHSYIHMCMTHSCNCIGVCKKSVRGLSMRTSFCSYVYKRDDMRMKSVSACGLSYIHRRVFQSIG
jgi:hypothetical protein